MCYSPTQHVMHATLAVTLLLTLTFCDGAMVNLNKFSDLGSRFNSMRGGRELRSGAAASPGDVFMRALLQRRYGTPDTNKVTTEGAPSVFLLPKRDVSAFVKRQDSSICCSLDVFCFACGRKKRSAHPLDNNNFYSKTKRAAPRYRNAEGHLEHDTNALERIAHRNGLVPILSRGLSMPDSFSIVAHGNTADDMLNSSDFEGLSESESDAGFPGQREMFGLVKQRR